MTVWRPIHRPLAGFLNNLSDSISILEATDPDMLAAVNDAPMWIASDYSGQHKEGEFEAYSFLITTADSVRQWNHERVAFRARYLPDGRRLSFKQLREPVRARALDPFLALANTLHGNLITFVVDKRLPSLFKENGKTDSSDLLEIFPEATSNTTVEKTLRLTMFLSLLIAGLRRENQPTVWISDQDEVLANFDRRERLAEFVSCTIVGMTGWTTPAMLEFGTTALDWKDRRLEDLVAIPDLVAGALAHIAPKLAIPAKAEVIATALSREQVKDRRTVKIVDWFAEHNHALRRMFLRITLDENGALRARAECIRSIRTSALP